MLVFLSDVHFTDGTSGETIKSAAFSVFSENLKKLIESVKNNPVQEIKVALLGDIFDLIRSTEWLAGAVRPWDPVGPEQEAVVLKILQGIINNNEKSIEYLRSLEALAGQMAGGFRTTYVIGNHDWLINRYASCRDLVAGSLGITQGKDPFPTELFEPDYSVFARHGDIYDKFNHRGNRDDSSVGDAVVIELLNKFPEEVRKGLKESNPIPGTEQDNIVRLLKELDNIRPLLDAPSWVLMVMNRVENTHVRRIIEETWTRCVDDLFEIPFIKKMDVPFWPDAIDQLEAALHLSSRISKFILEDIADMLKRFMPGAGDQEYAKHALAEPKVRSREASYVLYGHTHDHLIIPLDQAPTGSGATHDKIYFNTGTWRKTWNKVAYDPANREFIGWHVLTYVSVFKPSENGDYAFEVWNGALG